MKKILKLILLMIGIIFVTGCENLDCVDTVCFRYGYDSPGKDDSSIEAGVTAKYDIEINSRIGQYYKWSSYIDGSLNEIDSTCTEIKEENYKRKNVKIETADLVGGTVVHGKVVVYSDSSCTNKVAEHETNKLTVSNPGAIDGLEEAEYNTSYYQLSSVHNTEGEKTEEEMGNFNCFCASLAYAQIINEGSTNVSDYYLREDSNGACDNDEFNMKTGKSGAEAYKQAFEYIISKKQATVINVKEDSRSSSDCSSNHWVVVVGVSKDAYDTYVTDGKLNSKFTNASASDFEKTLFLLDTWPEKDSKRFFGMGKKVPYYGSSKTCYWTGKDNSLRIPA